MGLWLTTPSSQNSSHKSGRELMKRLLHPSSRRHPAIYHEKCPKVALIPTIFRHKTKEEYCFFNPRQGVNAMREISPCKKRCGEDLLHG